jgi:hypothetical protein
VRCGESRRQYDDYRIFEAIPSNTPESAWIVLTNYHSDCVSRLSVFLIYIAFLLVTVVPLAINGALSKFHKGHSTHAQRVWTMMWLGFGSLGLFLQNMNIRTGRPFRYLGLTLLHEDWRMMERFKSLGSGSYAFLSGSEISENARLPRTLGLFLLGISSKCRKNYPKISWKSSDEMPISSEVIFHAYLFLYAAPAIGGFVVVGQMLRSHGICVTVS